MRWRTGRGLEARRARSPATEEAEPRLEAVEDQREAVLELARLAGGRVSAVCSGANAELVRSLGAEEVVDHTTTALASLAGTYGVVLDTVGNVDIAFGRALLAPDGVLLLAVAGEAGVLHPADRPGGRRRSRVVVSRTVTLDEVVEAHRVVDSGRKVGNIVLTS